MPLSSLRPEFQRQIESLRKKVAANIQPKQVLGKTVNGDMFAELATSYVTALNEGGVPVISTALERAVQSQCRVRSCDCFSLCSFSDEVIDGIHVFRKRCEAR
jgi:hypothetical protein